MTPRRILWIVPKWPLPPDDGARRANYSLIRELTSRGEYLHMLALVMAGESVIADSAARELGLSGVTVVPRPSPASRIAKAAYYFVNSLLRPFVPMTMMPFAERSVVSAIELIGSQGWDLVVYDGLHPAIHSARRGVFYRPTWAKRLIYRAHNREADIWDRKADSLNHNGLVYGRLLGRIVSHQARRVRTFEDSVVAGVDGVATVSSDDVGRFESTKSGTAWEVVTIGYEFGTPAEGVQSTQGMRLLFLGKLDWPPNREGLQWFLTKVWPTVSAQRPDMHLDIAGSGDGEWLSRLMPIRGVTFHGRVPSVDPLYHQAAVSIVPVFYGSGTRVKVIEASRFACPCFSTALGVEGVGLESGVSFFRGESEGEWIDGLVKLTGAQAQIVGEAAYQKVREEFSSEASGDAFQRLIDRCFS